MADAAEELDCHVAGVFTGHAVVARLPGGTFTPGMLREALDKLYNAPVVWHGSEQDPHLYHPSPGFFYHRFCAACLMPREALTSADVVADIEPLPGRQVASTGINT